jgi:glyoxylase-like metal-dependent hydrolase (beta-lactamase superfamily II)
MSGVGGNVGVLLTTDGAVVVDTMTFPRQGNAVLRRIHELTAKPVAAIVNTHYHTSSISGSRSTA